VFVCGKIVLMLHFEFYSVGERDINILCLKDAGTPDSKHYIEVLPNNEVTLQLLKMARIKEENMYHSEMVTMCNKVNANKTEY
jgi:hypothetical protein